MKDDRYYVQSAGQALAVLTAVANSREPLGQAGVAQALGLSKNTAFRLCHTLEQEGWLERVGGDTYQVGMQAALVWARAKSRREADRDRAVRDIEQLEVA